MDIRAGLRRLDDKFLKNWYGEGIRIGGGGVRGRRPGEDLSAHLRYVADVGGFGAQVVAEDVLALLERVQSLEQRLSALEAK
jgi:hypothetical protein